MGMRYEVNQFNEVVPYNCGRKSNDTATYRELTGYEEQLLAEIDELNSRPPHNSEYMTALEVHLEYRNDIAFLGSFAEWLGKRLNSEE